MNEVVKNSTEVSKKTKRTTIKGIPPYYDKIVPLTISLLEFRTCK